MSDAPGFARGVAFDFPNHQRPDPVRAALCLMRDPDEPLVLLHSGRTDPRWSRYSVLAVPEEAITSAAEPSTGAASPMAALMDRIDGDEALWVGYLGYDIAFHLEPTAQAPDAERRARADHGFPGLWFARCPGWLVHDAVDDVWYACGDYELNPPRFDMDRASAGAGSAYVCRGVEPDRSREEHEQAVRAGIEYIAAGDVFQVNLAQRFTGRGVGPHLGLFQRLSQASPGWYGAYLQLDARRTLLSTPPELFLQVDAGGRVRTRPIKGTRALPPGVDPAGPTRELKASVKDAAELAMIVDLLRNDLGRVAEPGSVRVTESGGVELHPTVVHGVATVSARLPRDLPLADLLEAVFPGGSITGAPKIRAMQIIDELEPVRRGPYCGAIGFIDPRTGSAGDSSTPEARFSIAIRTLLHDGERVSFSVGGGIVADSDPADEYEETLAKAAAMLAALGVQADTP